MPSTGEVVHAIETIAPVYYQESYDNAGLQTGSYSADVTGVLLSLDITEEIIDEAVMLGTNLIISHHPLLFGELKNINGNNPVSRAIIKAIKNDISIYSCHTNIDNVSKGVNYKIAEKLGLENVEILKPVKGNLSKLVVFVPESYAEKVRAVIFESGGGTIGNYDCCSFNVSGQGTFRALENAKPFVGETLQQHTEAEIRIETIFPSFIEKKLVAAVIKAHPYEEVAYDLYPLNNTNPQVGSGAIGTLKEPMDESLFMQHVKNIFQIPVIRHTGFRNRPVKSVALCGGSGSFMLKDAMQAGADIFLTGDIKYHQFFDTDKKIILADIGHYESEQFTLEIFYELLIKNFSNFAICFTKVKTNPINYF